MVETHDPRLPSKPSVIKKNIYLLYQNEENRNIFENRLIIGSDKRRKNLGDVYKPSVPKRMIRYVPLEEPVFSPVANVKDIHTHVLSKN